ncbi:MAG TPA: flagellar hook-basal body complex protein FliE [Polyangiaceae bacterium]|nr:flagellar hook-basal body complex protein FliE [Polyangiaceae bacterium]
MSPLDAALPLYAPHIGREGELTPVPGMGPGKEAPGVGNVDPSGFESLVKDAVVKANQQINTAEHAGKEFAAGRVDDIHGTMLELSKADIELRFAGNVRNKVIDAFYELWRMQI